MAVDSLVGSKTTTDNSTINDTDRRLLALIGDDARTHTAVLARRLGLSRTTVHGRIERRERCGVICGYAVRLAGEGRDDRVCAHVMRTVQQKKAHRVEAQLRRIPEITALYAIGGEFDLIAVVAAPAVADIDRVIDEIGRIDGIDGIDRTLSSIVLSTKFDR